MRYLQYADSGEILCTGSAPDGSGVEHLGLVLIDPPEEAAPQTHYVEAGVCLLRAPRPSPHHTWNWPTKTWLPNLAAAQSARKSAVDQESAQRTFAPIAYDSALFDADAEKSRPRISGLLARLQRGDGLPDGWIGWRDADNAMHWATDPAEAVQAHLAALSAAIENREQALLIAAWQHKAAIDALSTVEAVLAHDLMAGWPA